MRIIIWQHVNLYLYFITMSFHTHFVLTFTQEDEAIVSRKKNWSEDFFRAIHHMELAVWPTSCHEFVFFILFLQGDWRVLHITVPSRTNHSKLVPEFQAWSLNLCKIKKEHLHFFKSFLEISWESLEFKYIFNVGRQQFTGAEHMKAQ